MSIEQQAKELEKLKLGALRAKYHEVFGAETKSNNRPYLIKKILQARQPRRDVAEESAAAPSLEAGTARSQHSLKQRDPRLPPAGTVLEREYQGQKLRAKVLDDGISFRGKTYTSLSKAALAATGTIWNGYVFWNLAKRITKAPSTETTS
jgi:hypothetical protein